MMMNRACKFILFMLILTGINSVYTVFAQGGLTGELIKRPQVEYKSSQLRDPFQSYLTDGRKAQGLQGASDLAKAAINIDALRVQGIIWGGKMPQAIINNQVLSVGDRVDGFSILSIDKDGVSLDVPGEVVNLPAPGYEKTAEKDIESGYNSGIPMNTQMRP